MKYSVKSLENRISYLEETTATIAEHQDTMEQDLKEIRKRIDSMFRQLNERANTALSSEFVRADCNGVSKLKRSDKMTASLNTPFYEKVKD